MKSLSLPHYLAVLAGGFGVFVLGWYGALAAHDAEEEKCMEQFTLINAEVVCEDHISVIDKANYTQLKGRIEDYIRDVGEKGVATHVSVYFRDLVNGPVMGIAETEDFAPASLLKVPVAFVFLNKEQDEPGFLASSPKLVFGDYATTTRTPEEVQAQPAPRNLNQAFAPLMPLEPGTPYSIEELLRRMLAQSDNKALDMLVQYIHEYMGGNTSIHAIFTELGLVEGGGFLDETVSVRGYASIFRALYHATYLNADLSQKVMQWLSESSFDAGLTAGVPKGVVVAHKFGERDWSKTNTHQLHDCGVVYYPGNPYLLCVMTKGKSTLELAPVISEISRMVYEEVDSRKLR